MKKYEMGSGHTNKQSNILQRIQFHYTNLIEDCLHRMSGTETTLWLYGAMLSRDG